MVKNQSTATAPFFATSDHKLTKKQKKANVAAGYLPDGADRKRKADGSARKVRTVRTLEERIEEMRARIAHDEDRLLVRAFADDATVKRYSLAISAMRALARHDGITACAGIADKMAEGRDNRIAELREQV